jgi:hypothetical protein
MEMAMHHPGAFKMQMTETYMYKQCRNYLLVAAIALTMVAPVGAMATEAVSQNVTDARQEARSGQRMPSARTCAPAP